MAPFQVHYTGQSEAVQYGPGPGATAEVNLDPDEFITELKARATEVSCICQLTFTSNKGIYSYGR